MARAMGFIGLGIFGLISVATLSYAQTPDQTPSPVDSQIALIKAKIKSELPSRGVALPGYGLSPRAR